MGHIQRAILVRLPIGAVFLILLLTATIRIQQYELLNRAKRLKGDIDRVEAERATLREVRVLLRRWNVDYGDSGSCSPEECRAGITICDFAYTHSGFFSRHQRLFRTYGVLGGRPAMVRAAVAVHNGLVRSKSFAMYIEVFPEESHAAGNTPLGYSLIGEMTVLQRLPPERAARSHNGYWIGWPGGCEVCIAIEVHATREASAEDVRRLSRFDFSCLARWLRPCRDKGDIMPTAWEEAKAQGLT